MEVGGGGRCQDSVDYVRGKMRIRSCQCSLDRVVAQDTGQEGVQK